MKTGKITLMAACVALSACATASTYEMSEDVAARLAEFEPTGSVESCLNSSSISQITPLDGRNFLVQVGVSQYYLNKVNGNCSGAERSFNRLQYTTSTSQLCRNEIITVVDNSSGFTVSSCGLGSFEKLEKIETE